MNFVLVILLLLHHRFQLSNWIAPTTSNSNTGSNRMTQINNCWNCERVFQPIEAVGAAPNSSITLTKRTCTCLVVIVRASEEGRNSIGSERGIATAAVEESDQGGVLRRAVSFSSKIIQSSFSWRLIWIGWELEWHPTDVAVSEEIARMKGSSTSPDC